MFLRKIIIGLAIIAASVFSFSTISNIFDGDFGWYLRFGKDAMEHWFPYADTYTWSYFGQLWVNHEWGGNTLFWLLYKHFGYITLEVLSAIAITAAFMVMPIVFLKKISIGSVSASFLCLVSAGFMLSVRPTTLAPLFLVWLIYTLEQLPNRRLLLTWPPLFWLWAALHGSWILGVIVIFIYLSGSVVEKLFPQFKMKSSGWTVQTYQAVLASLSISFLISVINPYGLAMWYEVGSYFTENYFKTHITEWLPSYYYPIYWSFIFLLGLSLVLMFRAWQRTKITAAHILLFLFFMLNAILYRRNILYFVLLITPLLSITFDTVLEALAIRPRLYKAALVCIVIALSGSVIYSVKNASFIPDPWHNYRFLSRNGFPVGAVLYLQQSGDTQIIFNEFHWGGFLNWTLPEAQVYLDGRGTATWHYSKDETLFEHYRTLRLEEQGLTAIEAMPANYILLEKSFTGYNQPNLLNRLTFGAEALAVITAPTSTQLEIDLTHSTRWEKVYEDSLSLLFKRRTQP